MTTPTAAQVIARADHPVTTRTGYGVPADHFAAVVVLDGIEFEYLFPGGAWDISGDAPALGRVRRIGNGPEFRAVRPDGTVALAAGYRENALAALTG